MQGLYENFYWYVYVNIIWICKKWMMHIIVEIHGELVRNLLSSSEYFFLSYNYKWDLEKVRSQILLTDLKILWCSIMMSCFGCILLNWSIKLLAINIDISHMFQTGSWHLRFPHSPPLTSQYVSAMIWLFCQVNGSFSYLFNSVFLRKIRVTVNQGFISFFNAITEGFTPFKNWTGSSWG